MYHLSSSFPLVVFIRFIIPYCQGFFRVNFALFRPVLHGFGFFGRSTDFVAALGAKKAATGRSFLQFIILDDGGAGGEVGFFFVKKSEFLLAFCVVSVFLIEKGFTNLGIVFVSLGEKQVGDALLKEVLQKIVGFDGGAGGVFFVVAKDEVVAVEEGFEICQQDEAVFDLGEIVAFSGE